MSKRQWCKALSGLWEQRDNPAVAAIVSDALEIAEELACPCDTCRQRQALFAAASYARYSGEDTELMARDSRGQPVIVHIHPERQDGEFCLHITARYPQHRLYQLVGE